MVPSQPRCLCLQGTNAHILLGCTPEARQPATQQLLAWQRSYTSVLLPASSMLQAALRSAAGRVTLSAALGTPGLSFLLDHGVGGRPIVPAAAYLEAALAAGHVLAAGRQLPDLALADVVISAPLALSGVGGAVTTVLAVEVALDSGGLTISSSSTHRPASQQRHISGCLSRVSSLPAPAPASEEVSDQEGVDSWYERAAASALHPLAGAGVYADFAAAGLQYGPAFRLLSGIRAGAGQAAARLLQPQPQHGAWLAHPAALDCCFQLGAAVQDAALAPRDMYVPAAVAAFHVPQQLRLGVGTKQLLAAAATPQGRAPPAPGALLRDMQLSQGGVQLCAVHGLESRRVSPQQLLAAGQQALPADRAPSALPQADTEYEVAWLASDALQQVPAGAQADPGSQRGQVALLLRREGAPAAAAALSAVQAAASGLQAVGLQLCTSHLAPGGVFSAAVAAVAAAGEQGVWGLLRSAAQEAADRVGVSAAHGSPYAPGCRPAAALLLEPSPQPRQPFDGYGVSQLASTSYVPRLVGSQRVVAAAPPHQLVPRPRGALTSLVPQVSPPRRCCC